jgi:hypothetical protein
LSNDKYSSFTQALNANNYILFDIPFLLSLKSDASRYLWFDWHSRWTSIEVQPSSIAKYSLAGLPYSTKLYEFASQLGDELNDSENYLSKLTHARKNYMVNWDRSPYLYLRMANWFRINSLYYNKNTDIVTIKYLLFASDNFWKNEFYTQFLVRTSTPSFSGVNTVNKITHTPLSNISGYSYASSALIDILSKREYLYRVFLKNKSLSTVLPEFFSTSINSKLLVELKSLFSYIDPITLRSEISRELLLQNTLLLKYDLAENFSKLVSKSLYKLPINLEFINTGVSYFAPTSLLNLQTDLGLKETFFKSQYQPMRKGITNMIRLQATNAIAMPTEIRLHILASSKDVIHSWAIPSAGIKIDCVPGYSSHRVMIFLTHGIFWGQCMEICGRYHHWMPIIVYFMKRDLFFLW